MSRSILLAALLVAAVASGAQAQSVFNVLTAHRLLGAWQTDCTRPPASDNPRLTLAAQPKGPGSMIWDEGPAGRTVSVIKAARDLTADRFLLHRYQPDDNSLVDFIFGRTGGKLRLLDAREADTDKFLVRDSVDLASGRPTASLERCP